MRSLSLASLISLFLSLLLTETLAQKTPGNICDDLAGALYGNANVNERGKNVLATPDGNGVYVLGRSNDRVLISRMTLKGREEWTRTFDIVPNKSDHVTSTILDSEGNLVTIGIAGDYFDGGTVFAFRYNPETNTMLWTKEYITPALRSYGFAIVQKEPGGNYILSTNPHHSPDFINDFQIFEVNKSNGNLVTNQIKNYDLGGSDNLAEMVMHNGFIYATGRFSDGNQMRNTLAKIDPQTKSWEWVKLGHFDLSNNARIYGKDLVIHQDFIYSNYSGDPEGGGTVSTKAFAQKSTLDGSLVWLKQIELPGAMDVAYQVIESDGGFIHLMSTGQTNSSTYIFKLNAEGQFLWAKHLQFPDEVESVEVDRGNSQIIRVGDQLFILATAIYGNGTSDIILVRTDLDGNAHIPCITTVNVSLPVTDVDNPNFYNVEPEEYNSSLEVENYSATAQESSLPPLADCIVSDTVFHFVAATICLGDTLEGYTASGVYEDIFVVEDGCDSIRTLTLTVIACGPDCTPSGGNLFGSPLINESAECIATSLEKDAVYIAGHKGDSTLLIKMNLAGDIIWSITVDVIPGQSEVPAGIVADADGMIGIAGTGRDQAMGNTFYALRYNPETHTVLWAHEYQHSPNDYSFGMIEKGPGGNYLLTNQPTWWNLTLQPAQIVEIDKQTGAVIPLLARNYLDHETETWIDLAYHENAIYAVGRFKNGGFQSHFRTTIAKLDATSGEQVWLKMGHVSQSGSARLYCTDLVIADNSIYSIVYGDPVGSSSTDTKIFVHRHDLEGNLIWIRQYEIPGSTDVSYDFIKSGNGFVAYIYESTNGGLALFKIDADGNVLWANSYSISSHTLPTHNTFGFGSRGNSLLTQAGNKLFFVGKALSTSGDADAYIIHTDLEGNISEPCVTSQAITVTSLPVNNPVFYDDPAEESEVEFEVTDHSPASNPSLVPVSQECSVTDTIYTFLEASICEGDSFEGYTEAGTYEDLFVTTAGCDSVRILTLAVTDCNPSGCGHSVGALYGTPSGNEEAYSLAATPQQDGYYATGHKGDSVLIMKLNLSGEILWAKALLIVPGKTNHAGTILVDSEGNLVINGGASGVSINYGTLFAFRYNPITHQVLWANEYVTNLVDELTLGILEKGPGGNFVMFSNPNDSDVSNDDLAVIELERSTGTIVPGFSKNYNLGASESLNALIYYNNSLFGTGRFTDGFTAGQMRNTLIKLNENNGQVDWVRLGHRPNNVTQRLYGFDLVIENDEIYSGYLGDPDGATLTQTLLYLQKTSLDANLLWLKQYDIPGPNDFAYEMVKSGNGLVVLASDHSGTPDNIYLFKIDFSGNVLWAKNYSFPDVTNADVFSFGRHQLIAMDDMLVFASFGNVAGQGKQMIIARTDLNGELIGPCGSSRDITVLVQEVDNPSFYSRDINVTESVHTIRNVTPTVSPVFIEPAEACLAVDTIYTFLEVSICAGDTVEGYTSSGTYIDEFLSTEGCDSIRTLVLHVVSCDAIVAYNLDACSSFMSNGSHMDYSEFVPEYPNEAACVTLAATNVYRDPPQENKHSCTQGVNGSIAMCISSLPTCTYIAGHDASLVFEVNVVPSPDSVLRISKLEFFERSPLNYSWIGGSSGLNNYPRFYGLRVLANNIEIYRQTGIGTHADWTLQSYSFPDLAGFNISEPTLLRVEFLPYCPIGNGAPVAAWDIDEIHLFGGCVSSGPNITGIGGTVKTSKGEPVSHIKVSLGENHYSVDLETYTEDDGLYEFNNLKKGLRYYLEATSNLDAASNQDVLKGVNTLDLIAIQKHLLGIKLLESLPQYIAADINHNDRISITDIVDLQKTLLGIHPSFPNNTSWRAGNCRRIISNDMDDFIEKESIGPVSADHVRFDMMAIKVGDVNEDIQLNGQGNLLESRSTYSITFEDREVNQFQEFTVSFVASEATQLEGIQLAYDLSQFQLIRLESKKISLEKEHYHLLANGELRIVWSTGHVLSINEGDVLFSMVLKSKSGGLLSNQLLLSKGFFRSELFSVNAVKDISLQANQDFRHTGPNLTSISVEPNPFRNSTYILFHVAKPGPVSFTFYDLSGREINKLTQVYTSGSQRVEFGPEILGETEAIIICQLHSNGQLFTQKLVRMP